MNCEEFNLIAKQNSESHHFVQHFGWCKEEFLRSNGEFKKSSFPDFFAVRVHGHSRSIYMIMCTIS